MSIAARLLFFVLMVTACKNEDGKAPFLGSTWKGRSSEQDADAGAEYGGGLNNEKRVMTKGKTGYVSGTGTTRAEDAGDEESACDACSDLEPECEPNCPDLGWVTIAGGTYMMGSDWEVGEEAEHPRHKVTVQSFKIMKTEVTVSQYRVCVEAGVCTEPDQFTEYDMSPDLYNWIYPDRENHPVNRVLWGQAREFALWVGARLPSEAEWEYAARSGGQDIVYPWGNEEPTCEYGVINYADKYCGTDSSGTMEVCSKSMGNTAQGLCDMAGNVTEWIEDAFHRDYDLAPSDGQAWSEHSGEESEVVVRGCAFDSWADDCRSTTRRNADTTDNKDIRGFRVVMDI
ncbi:MAG: formylglycine-generating enzyme family protein [Deltaproteobacteria bacterium]|nr:formylglycine-generating enzyme family protein [Deltaproteobacteria bacterium]